MGIIEAASWLQEKLKFLERNAKAYVQEEYLGIYLMIQEEEEDPAWVKVQWQGDYHVVGTNPFCCQAQLEGWEKQKREKGMYNEEFLKEVLVCFLEAEKDKKKERKEK